MVARTGAHATALRRGGSGESGRGVEPIRDATKTAAAASARGSVDAPWGLSCLYVQHAQASGLAAQTTVRTFSD